MSSRELMIEVASIGKGDGAHAHPCRYIVLPCRSLLVKRVDHLVRTVAECGAELAIVCAATPPSVLAPHGQSTGCPRRQVRDMARAPGFTLVEEVAAPNAAPLHRGAIKPRTVTTT